MTVTFRLPDIGEGVAEAQIVDWLVEEGDQVERDQSVVEVQTDKAVVELPAPRAGQVTEIKWKEGEVVPVGEVLYVLDDEGVDYTEAAVEIGSKRKPVLAAPSTRRLAREYGIDIHHVKGTGVDGRVLDQDIRSFAASLHTKESQVKKRTISLMEDREAIETSLSPVRRTIADRLLFSVSHKPHATHFDELDVKGLVEWRKNRKSESDRPHLTYTTIFIKWVAIALRDHSYLNAHFDEDSQTVLVYPSISIGIATDTPQGLLVPVIHQVEKKSVDEIALEMEQLTQQARSGKLPPDRLKGSTFTISNAGTLGGKWATPIINPPEVAILAIHPIEQKPVVVDGQLAVGWRMNISLSFDHRVLDGAHAIAFTQRLGRYTADPGCLLREFI